MWLTRLALRNPVFILMMSLMVLVLGAISLDRLSVDLFPRFTMPVVRVATFYPGAGPADIERSITQPIERAVSATPGVDRVESSSKQGASVVSVWFGYDTNLDNAQFEVSQRVAQILSSLPQGIQQPFVTKFDITNIPVASVAVTAEGLDERQLYDLAYNTIEPQLERLPGVASAAVGGGLQREIQVRVQRDALHARGLGILEVVNAVRASNFLLPSGSLRAGDRDYAVYSNTQFARPGALRDLVVRATPGGSATAVRLGDLATVEDGSADRSEIVRINGQRGVYLRVLKQPDANTIAVVDGVRRILPNLRGVPANVRLSLSFDQSTYVRAAVRSLEHEALQGGLLAIFVILAFLASLRATGIVAVAIPLSIVATFALLFFSGQSLNVFTLGGLALGVGRLVDDSIVELENIHRHLAQGQDRRSAVLAAAQEVAAPILVSTITTIVVFFPVLFLQGVARNLFVPLALTIAFALMMSFLVSRTVTPLMCLYWLKATPHDQRQPGVGGAIQRALDRLDRAYGRALGWVLGHRALTVLVILGLFGSSLLLFSRIGSEFFPESDEGQVAVVFKTPIGTRVERTGQVAERIERIMAQTLGTSAGGRPHFTTLISTSGVPMGRGGMMSSNSGSHAGTLQVNLVPVAARPFSSQGAAERLRAALRNALPGSQYFLSTGGIVKRMLNFGSSAPIDVEILGFDLDEGAAYARRLLPRMRSLRSPDGRSLLTDVQVSREENSPELHVTVDREKAGVLGLSEQQVAQSVLASLLGNSQFAPIPYSDPQTGNVYQINVRLDDPFRSHVADLADIPIRTPGGTLVSLGTVAAIDRDTGPVLINRKYMQRVIDVTANIDPAADLGAATTAMQRLLEELPPPEGFTAQLGGQSAAQREAFGGLALAGLLAIVLVYMVLASQFRSLLDPLVIMVSVPLGVSGVFVMLFLTKTTLSVNSFMGIIMMVGIVVSNGVLLVDFANQLRERGREVREAIIEAGRTRLRPILMTTIATVLGLMPMAIGLGEGSETNLPLARAVIGGLSVSTVFTLFLVPVLYTVLERFSRRGHDRVDDDAAPAPVEGPA